MTLEQLIAQFRVDSEDKLEPYLFADESVIQWLNEAQEEACVRALLLKDWATPAVCSIAVLADVSAYQLHESVINITRAEFTATGETDGTLLWQADEYELDRMEPGWRKLSATPTAFIHHDTALRIGCQPPAGTLALEVNRLPLWPMENDSDTPEIAAIHHRHLVLWALHRAFSIPDSETVDANRAALAELQFTRAFGHRPDANTRRGHESSRPHHNSSCWMG
jgi:hypothetical protein